MKLENNIKTPFGEIGYITMKRTYSRRLKEDVLNSPTEELSDIVNREITACNKQLKVGFTKEEEEYYFNTRMNLKWSVAGRFMWQLGTKTVDKLGLPSLQNCSGVVVDSPIRPFTWTFEMLMLGSGKYNYNYYNKCLNIKKQGELLENPTLERQKEDNQQPSLTSNSFEGSTTNSQVQTDNTEDSNTNKSALPGINNTSFKILIKKEWFNNSDDIV